MVVTTHHPPLKTHNLRRVIPKLLDFLVSPDLPPAQLHQLFDVAGHQLFLVGGSVRDAFLERPLEDYDFATDARPDRIAELLETWADVVYHVGATFGTVAARKNGHVVEVTTFRNEVYRDDSRKPQVTFSDDIETDLARRDFTVNAIALSLDGHGTDRSPRWPRRPGRRGIADPAGS